MNTLVATALVAGVAALAITSQSRPMQAQNSASGQPATAVFAGGCFWCVESDFDKVEGVLSTISGYTGGSVDNSSYRDVTGGTTGHYKPFEITFNPNVVTYPELVEYFFRHVDPTDADSQFCDRGQSYATAIFAQNGAQAATAAGIKAELDRLALPGPIVTPILDAAPFWPAEGYHQDYYQKNPLRYNIYWSACGRDARVGEV